MIDRHNNLGLTDRVTLQEIERAYSDKSKLECAHWSKPLLTNIGDLQKFDTSRDFLFELRFAAELHSAGITNVEYEYKAGIGESSIDFRFENNKKWLVELLSIHESAAVKRSTHYHDTGNGITAIYQHLGHNPKDKNANETAELIRVQEKIGEKVFEYGQPTKFPEPTDSIHMILVDCRGALGMGLDDCDYRQLAWGPYTFSEKDYWLINKIQREDGLYYPINGLFDPNHPGQYSEFIRSRIHFLAFTSEEDYQDNSISKALRIYWNPLLLGTTYPSSIIESFPLFRSQT